VRWINVPNVRIGIFNKVKKRGKQVEEQTNRRTHPESDMAFQHWTTQTDDFDRASGGGDVGSDAVHTWCQRVKRFSCTVVTQLQLQSQLARLTSKRVTLFSSYTSHVT
jgi:hypothetical protein